MTDDKPLNVQVAESLGWTGVAYGNPYPGCGGYGGSGYEDTWLGTPTATLKELHHMLGDRWVHIPILRYDTDWSATGPLIEKYGISLSFNGEHWFSDVNDEEGEPSCHHIGPRSGFAPCADQADEPLISVCHTLLVLKEAGKLKETE